MAAPRKKHDETKKDALTLNNHTTGSPSGAQSPSSKGGPKVAPVGISTRGLVAMALLAVQFGSQPLLTQIFVSTSVLKTSSVLVCEVLKLVLGLAMVFVDGGGRNAFATWSLSSSLFAAGLPAVLYAMQNILIQLSMQNLGGLAFNLLNQTKVLWTVFFLYLMLGQKQSGPQMGALLALAGASFLLSQSERDSSNDSSFYYGVLPALAASVLSGLSSAISQRVLQKNKRDSYLYSAELAFFSTLTLLISVIARGENIFTVETFFNSWTAFTLIPIVSNSMGGLLVGQVTKFAGGERKGFSIIAGILLSAVLQTSFEGKQLSSIVLFCLPIVVTSTWIHIKFPYVAPKKD